MNLLKSCTFTVTGFLATLVGSIPAHAKLCTQWSPPKIVGYLDTQEIGEASGLAISEDGNFAFHINDGHANTIFVTDMTGGNTRAVEVESYKGYDVEELVSGTVDGTRYVIIGDLGDNKQSREYLKLGIVRESEILSGEGSPHSITTYFTYPDGPRDAESMALHPNGDIYVVSKEESASRARIARVYRLKKNQWRESKATQKNPEIMEFIGTIDVPKINSEAPTEYGKLTTGIDISADGRRLVLLTYFNAIEVDIELNRFSARRVIPRFALKTNKVSFTRLTQQEAIKYLPNRDAVMITTEFDEELGRKEGAQEPTKSPILVIECEKRD